MRYQSVVGGAAICTDRRGTKHSMATQLAVNKCLGCGKEHRTALKVPRGGSLARNWSIAGYCSDCRPRYEAFLRNVDDASWGMRPIAEEIMEGWNASPQHHPVRPRVPAVCMCRFPRANRLPADLARH